MPKETITQSCPRCGGLYKCGHNSSQPCWCQSVKVSDQNLKMLSQMYSRCLCKSCLSLFSEKHFSDIKHKAENQAMLMDSTFVQ